MGAGGDFSVSLGKTETVAAVIPLSEYWLPMSNLDLLVPPKDVGVFFCYKKPVNGVGCSWTYASIVSALKNGLAQALVSYYALAGELVVNFAGEPEILCNNRGVDFIEAYADIELRDLNLYNPDDSIGAKLMPKKKRGVLSVQVTELKCGGLLVSCVLDHRVADAYSANQFLVSWAEAAQSKPISLLPCLRRSLLNPRRPGSYHPSIESSYIPFPELPPPNSSPSDYVISRIYYIPENQLSQLQSSATNTNIGKKRTKVEIFSAFLWKMVAECANVDKKIFKMGMVVDGRNRLCDGDDDDDKVKMMATYFGNVIAMAFAEKKRDELVEKPLSWVADEVHDYLESTATKEHFLGLIDWVEVHRPRHVIANIFSNGSDDGPPFVVSSGRRFPVLKVDFGWGKPAFGSYYSLWAGPVGYVMPMPSPKGNGDWVVYMQLLKSQLNFIETHAAHIFRPITFDYLP